MARLDLARSAAIGLMLALAAGCASTPPAEGVKAASAPTVTPRQKPKMPPAPNTDDIIGFTPARIEETFGVPDLRRKDRGAEVWQFPAEDCVLFVFMYDNPDGTSEASYLEAIPSDGRERPVAAELGPFLNQCVKAAARKHWLNANSNPQS